MWKKVNGESTAQHRRASSAADAEDLYLIWDTAGDERLKPSRQWYTYWPVDGLILVYDCSNIQSFLHVQEHLQQINRHPKSMTVLLVSNKCDLGKEKVVVPSAVGKTLADSLGILFLETSAKESVNVQDAFVIAAGGYGHRRQSSTDKDHRSITTGCFSFKMNR